MNPTAPNTVILSTIEYVNRLNMLQTLSLNDTQKVELITQIFGILCGSCKDFVSQLITLPHFHLLFAPSDLKLITPISKQELIVATQDVSQMMMYDLMHHDLIMFNIQDNFPYIPARVTLSFIHLDRIYTFR